MPETGLALRPRPDAGLRPTSRLWGRVKLANFMDLREDDFRRFVGELERDPLFRRLAACENPEERVFSRRRFPGTDIASRCCEFNEETLAAAAPPDAAPLLEKWKELLPALQRIEIEDFKRWFLYGAPDADARSAAEACGLSVEQVRQIKTLLDDFYLLDLAQPAPPGPAPSNPGIVTLAVVEVEAEGVPRIAYLSAHDARGAYAINYKKLYELEHQGRFSRAEFRRIRKLIRDMELANTRQAAVHRILKRIVETQAEYFRTRREDSLLPLTQQMLARELGVHRSTVHRAVEHRCLETPWGEVRSLKSLLGNQKRCTQRLLARLTREEGTAYSDEELRRILAEEHGVRVARRTVCAWRSGLVDGS